MKKICFLAAFLFPFLIQAQSITGAVKYSVDPYDTVVINGVGFNTTTNAVYIFFGTSRIKPISITSSIIKFIAPYYINSGKILYTDTVSKKTICSKFDIHVSTLFAKNSSIDKKFFEQEVNLKLDTILSSDNPVLFADFDNDGIDELIVSSKNFFRISIYSNKSKFGNVNLKKECDLKKSKGYIISISDYNQDGKTDIITLKKDTFIFWFNTSKNGAISFKDTLFRKLSDVIKHPMEANYFVDFNGDGRGDFNTVNMIQSSDPAFFLNKQGSNGNVTIKSVLPGSNLKVYLIDPVNIDGDSLTDLVGVSQNSSKTYIYKNISKGDTIKFKLVDSINQFTKLLNRMDFNKDGIKDLIFEKWNGGKAFLWLLVNNSTKDTVKLKEMKSIITINYDRPPVFWDYNFDSIPDAFYRWKDSIYCLTLSIRNDSLVGKRTAIRDRYGMIPYLVKDVDFNNQPDFVFTENGQPLISFVLGNGIPCKMQNTSFTYYTDSVNQIFSDSIVLSNQSYKTLIVDTINTKSNIQFYTSEQFTTKLKFPLTAAVNAQLKVYFKAKYISDSEDTFWLNNQKFSHLGTISMKYVTPCANIKSVDKILARPGDTITLRGSYFFKKLTDISVRMNNRRCQILASSKDTSLKFIYPALTSSTKILIIDTAKHYNVYSAETIYPTFRRDTSNLFNMKSFQRSVPNDFKSYYTDVQINTEYNNYFELPFKVKTGHGIGNTSCFVPQSDTSGDGYFGAVDLTPTTSAKSFTRVNIQGPQNQWYLPSGFLKENQQWLFDLNTDGILDCIDLIRDTFAVYQCVKAEDTTVVYNERQQILIKENHFGVHMINSNLNVSYDLDRDGLNEILTWANDTIFLLNYDVKINKLVVKDYLTNTPLAKIADFTNDGKLDLLCQENYNGFNKYYVLENKSVRGDIVFSEKKMVLIDSVKSYNLSFHLHYLNDDKLQDLIIVDGQKDQYWVYLYGTDRKFKLLESFTSKDPFYNFKDFDGDGKPELIGKHIHRFTIKNGKFNLSRLFIDSSFNYMDIDIVDADGDCKPDIVTSYLNSSKVYFNTTYYARFKDVKPEIFETDNYGNKKTDSFYIYNAGSRNIQLKKLIQPDTNFMISGKNKLPFNYPVLIRASDSLLVCVTFSPKIKPKKFYNAMLSTEFVEDLPVIYKELWGYVNIPPVITKVLPDILIAGDTAAISGRNFDNLKSRPSVIFGNSKAEIIVYDDTLILVKVPYGGQNGVVTVYDTALDLQCFSPKPLQYSFMGTSGKINVNSFESHRIRRTMNYGNYYIRDYDQDGLPDILYDTMVSSSLLSAKSMNFSVKGALEFKKPDRLNFLYPQYMINLYKDLNGDGIEENLVFRSGNSAGYSLLFMSFDYQYYRYVFRDRSYGCSGYAIGDLNNNGKPEIIFGNQFPQTGIYEHNLKKVKENINCDNIEADFEKLTYTKKTKGSPIFSYDFDGDGKTEVLYVDTFMKVAFNLSNKDSFHFSQPLKLPNDQFNWYIDDYIHVVDMNYDGKLDVVTTNQNGNGLKWITVYKNACTKGKLSFIADTQVFRNNFNLDRILCQDFNGDMKPDIVMFTSPLKDSFIIVTNTSTTSAIKLKKFEKFKTKGVVRDMLTSDMDADSKNDLILQTDSGLFILKNTNISGYLSRQSDTFRSQFGFPLSFSLALYSVGGDTLIIDKIEIPKNYKLVNSSGNFSLGSFSGIGQSGVSLPIKINSRDSFHFDIQMDENTKPGKYRDTFLFYNNERLEPYQFIVSGEIKPAALAYVNKESIDFGKIKINKVATDSFYIKNIGYDTLKVSGISTTDTIHFKFSYDKKLSNIVSGDSIKCYVSFLAVKRGNFTMAVKVKHNDYRKESTLYVNAECIEPVIVDSVKLDFKDHYVSTIISDTIYIINSGTDTLWIKDIKMPSTSSPWSFKISKNKSDFVLQKDTIRIIALFSPDTIKTYNTTISIEHNAAHKFTFINFIGEGVGSKMAPEDFHIDLGKLTIKRSYTFSNAFNNEGNRKLKILVMTNSNSDFKHAICPATTDSINANNSSNICTSVKNLKEGIVFDTLGVFNNGINPLVKWYYKAEWIKPVPVVSVLRDTVDFGEVGIGKNRTDSFEILNFSNDTQTIYFSNLNNPFVNSTGLDSMILYPGKKKAVTLSFVPKTAKHYSDILYLTNIYDDTLSAVILKGNSPAISILRNVIDFGDVSIGAVKKDSFELYNFGNETINLYLSNIKLPFLNLDIQNPKTLYPGNRKNVIVSFNPMIKKAYVDTLYFANIYGDTLGSLILKGNSPAINISTSLLDFGDVIIGGDKKDSFELYNFGNDTINIYLSTIQLPFLNLDIQSPKRLYPGSRKNVVVSFNPKTSQQYADTIFITNAFNFAIGSVILKGNSPNTSNKVLSVSDRISVYPNPAADFLTIEFRDALINEVGIEFNDILGKVVMVNHVKRNNIIVIDTKSIQNGIYFLSINYNNKLYTTKIVIYH